MNRPTTPQWRSLIRGLIAACLVLILINAQSWLLLTHRASPAEVSGVAGLVGATVGALALLLGMARAWRWPLPRTLRGPASASQYGWRLALVGVVLIVAGVLMAHSLLPLR